ncbi:MAG TPA: UDP-glucose/GDP-mannose dehydrogenase family protein [Defluviitaleaceae bacterium]|nr:UDP-glucose/GDP-mannose dehydrogenase family protein [Defluviitaleaceae bacterium]
MNRIGIIGSGYVGLVTGACLADFGMKVMCVDIDEDKINQLKEGKIPIYEPGLEQLVERNTYYKRLSFTTDIEQVVSESDVIFIAVGTPPAEDGSADLTYVLKAAEDIASYMNEYKVIVDKSTVPIGTGQKVKNIVKKVLESRNAQIDFDVVSNPEFLREGSAIYDFTHPDRVVIGGESEKAIEIMKGVYRVLYLNETPFIITNIETAEMIKYASNGFLAMKVTFINEIANFCEKVGANVQEVAKAMGRDGRIGPKFLHPGPGYGGSCFPKDTRALARMAKEHNSPITLIEATIEANERQKLLMVKKVKDAIGDLNNKTLAILGVTFKQNTDDMRESPALTIIGELEKLGASFRIYDPQGMKEAKWRLKSIEEKCVYCKNEYEAVKDADALLIITEWNQFRNLDIDSIKNSMKGNFFFDFRNIYDRAYIESKGFNYYAVGR